MTMKEPVWTKDLQKGNKTDERKYKNKKIEQKERKMEE